MKGHSLRADHALCTVAVGPEGIALDEHVDELLLALLQAQFCETVLMGNSVILHAAQTQNQGANDACSVLPSRAVHQQRSGSIAAGQVLQDGGERGVRVVFGRSSSQNVLVDADEALRGISIASGCYRMIRAGGS